MAQLNRECEKRDDKRPLLSDLKASGAIEERAKCVVMLYRPAVYDEAAPRDVVELLIRKNNQGQTGIAFARWAGETIRMH
jgi:replicative DNA helicase